MTCYATDEDIALRASADFWSLCPRDQLLASGSDGVFLASDPWTLTSASVDFSSLGLATGQVVRLTKPTPSFGASGDLFAIQAVSSGAITLRRKGQAAGVGQPPASTSGLTNVEFAVRTLGPQIYLASFDIDHRFGIDDRIVGRRAVDLDNPRQLREAVVLTVLYKQYLDQSRQFSGPSDAPDDWYAAKARIAKAELTEVLDRLAIKWNAADVAARAIATTRFSTRVSR
jgi:hypothetical protein